MQRQVRKKDEINSGGWCRLGHKKGDDKLTKVIYSEVVHTKATTTLATQIPVHVVTD
jgi:hypothetical protein